MKRKNFDVIVIGGGYSGCSTAYYLAKAGVDVALIEMNAICSGASGRNGGQVIQLEGRDELTKDKIIKRNSITKPNKELLKGLSNELGIDIELILNGSLDVAFTEEEVKVIKKVINLQKEVGDADVEFIEPKDIKNFCKAYGTNFKGAKFRKDDGSVNPFKMTYGYALAAKKLGCYILTYTKVNSIIFKKDKAIGVSTDKGNYFANHGIVYAVNAWTIFLLNDYPVIPCKILGFVTERLPIIPILSVEAYAKSIALYGSSQKDGSILIGGAPFYCPTSMYEHLSSDVMFEDFIRYGSLFRFTWPNIKDVNFIRAWAGAVAFTPDSFPLVGKTKYKNLYINVGFTNGNSWCPICGKLMAELIVNDGNTSIPINFLNPERFSGIKFSWPKEYNYTILHNYIAEKMG